MKIIYNIEDFVIKEMFIPYQNIIVENPTKENINKCKNIFRKNPEEIISALRNNKKAYECVFGRLARIDFKFYKWLKHPLTEEIEAITLAFRNKEREENEQ